MITMGDIIAVCNLIVSICNFVVFYLTYRVNKHSIST